MSLEHYRPLIDMKDFRLMYAVAKHASVTGAANELSLSQSALSHQLAKLESKLNLSLFDSKFGHQRSIQTEYTSLHRQS